MKLKPQKVLMVTELRERNCAIMCDVLYFFEYIEVKKSSSSLAVVPMLDHL